ncbi:hypothetical protein [Streptomyces griseoruber]|uniref:hypothetical protein n=1 Tax=Streptomyces griseoruber TaxID=1943 RepID=UPI00379C6940
MGSAVTRRDIPRYGELYRAGLFPVGLLADSEVPLAEVNTALDRLADGAVGRQLIRPN